MAVLRAAVLRAAALRALHGVMAQRGTRRLPAKGVCVLFCERENNPPLTSVPVQRTESRRSALWALMSCLLRGSKEKSPPA